jgi:prephenate dehydrogenase
VQIDQLTIVGVGLIGGSVGLAAKARGVARRVVGVGRDDRTLSRAAAGGVIDSFTTTIADGVANADFVVVCTPVDRVAADVLTAVRGAPPRAVVTDAGSTKGNIVRELAGKFPDGGAHFVGSHPLAGSEKKGAAFAKADLFQDRVVVVTPTADTDPEAVSVVDAFWLSLGARVVRMDPFEHDSALAFTSHLPHAAASGLAGVTPPGWLNLTAGGFRDTTRIAAGDPELWAAIFEANRDAVLAATDAFAARMAEFREALTTGDREKLVKWLADGKRVRDTLG